MNHGSSLIPIAGLQTLQVGSLFSLFCIYTKQVLRPVQKSEGVLPSCHDPMCWENNHPPLLAYYSSAFSPTFPSLPHAQKKKLRIRPSKVSLKKNVCLPVVLLSTWWIMIQVWFQLLGYKRGRGVVCFLSFVSILNKSCVQPKRARRSSYI